MNDAAWLGKIWTLTLLALALLANYPFATRGFRPRFQESVRGTMS